jgi:selenide,water dikinase
MGVLDELTQLKIADAQTSGGLVFGVDPAATADVLAELAATGHTAARIGATVAASSSVSLRLAT